MSSTSTSSNNMLALPSNSVATTSNNTLSLPSAESNEEILQRKLNSALLEAEKWRRIALGLESSLDSAVDALREASTDRSRPEPSPSPIPRALSMLVSMPPMRIILVRHGQSLANVDKTYYKKVADSVVPLSTEGLRQAKIAGQRLQEYFQNLFPYHKPPIRCWTSFYERARQTAEVLKDNCTYIDDMVEDILLGEQQFGLFEGIDWTAGELSELYPKEKAYYDKAVLHGRRFFAKCPLGESRMDVCMRAKQFFGTLHRDALRHGITNVVIVSHGVTIRAIIAMWMRKSPQWFEESQNPMNCSMQVLDEDGGEPRFIHGSFEERASRVDLLTPCESYC